MSIVGSSPAELQAAAGELERAADWVRSSASELSGSLGLLSWAGAGALQFTDIWTSRYRPALGSTEGFLRDQANRLREQAQQQLAASGDGGGTAGPSMSDNGKWGGLFQSLALGSAAALSFVTAHSSTDLFKRLGDKGVQVLGVLDKIDTFSQSWVALNRAAALNSAAVALTGRMASAGDAFVNFGGKTPVLGSAIVTADILWNVTSHGLNTPETNEAMVLGPMGLAASFVAGPLGGIAFTGGTVIGHYITDHSSIDEVGAQAAFDTAYGDRVPVVPEKSAEWYRTATPEATEAYAAAQRAAVAESARIVERTNKPWLFAMDYVAGGVKGWLS